MTVLKFSAIIFVSSGTWDPPGKEELPMSGVINSIEKDFFIHPHFKT